MTDEIDPTEFVQRIRQLGEQRDQQDAERVKKLEEDLIQGRSERLARRAERARSISPDKPITPQSIRSAAGTPRDIEEKAANTPTPVMSPPAEDTEPTKSVTSAAALGRSGTLSWKQRPQSGSMRRPLSMVSRSPERPMSTSPTKTPEPSSPEPNVSRSSIAASLGAKDPSYFKQTPDRGVGSAAYRRSQDEAASATGSVTESGKKQLPGMSRESTVEPEISSPPPESVRSSSPGSRGGSMRGSAMLAIRSPLPMLDSQKFAPPSEQGGALVDGGESERAARAFAMSPTQERMLPERARSSSPTKGMGGFVQSAMLKRSDSVSKRWSTQTPPGLTRQGSTLSNRGSAMTGFGTLSKAERPSSLSRDNSIEPSSRPTSSHSNATITKRPDADRTSRDEFVKPALPYHSRSKSVASSFSEREQPQDETSPPSPSKRWSPTKSSWLENALNKPNSPKPKQAPPAQPAWMAEINRIKQQRSSVDLGKDSSAEPFGSGRTSPIKDVQLKPATLRRVGSPVKDVPADPEKVEPPASLRKFDTPKKDLSTEPENTEELANSKPVLSSKPPLSEEEVKPPEIPDPITELPKETPMAAPAKPVVVAPLPISARFPPVAKPKPEISSTNDFRAGLKPRRPTGDSSKQNEVSEFQNVFGKLKKAETKNYVAPDTLKSNILSGKSALTVTGGPKPTVRRDEFRESLIKKKSAMQLRAQDTGSVLKTADSSAQPPPTPEAISKRGILGRADNAPKPPSPEKSKATTPEALARKKSLRHMKPVIDDKPVQSAPLFASKEPGKTSKLADRFNPGLAGMLARGPPPLTTNKSTSSADGAGSPVKAAQDEAKSGPAPDLQHMTKGRARGPKRRAPGAKQIGGEPEKTQPQQVASDETTVPLVKPKHVLPSSVPTKTNGTPEELPVTKTPSRQSLVGKPATPARSSRIVSGQFGGVTPVPTNMPVALELEKTPQAQDVSKLSPRPESIAPPRMSSPNIPKKPTSLDPERKASGAYATPQKSSLPPPIQPPKPTSPVPSPASFQSRFSRPLPTSPANTTKPTVETPKPMMASKEIITPKAEVSPTKDEPSPPGMSPFASVRSATSLWGRQAASSSPLAAKTKSQIKLPTKADEEAAMQDAGLVRTPNQPSTSRPTSTEASVPKPLSPVVQKSFPPKPKPTGLGFSLSSLSGYLPARSRESSPQPPTNNLPASPPMSGGRPQSEPFKSSPMPVKYDGLFADFFDEAPTTQGGLPSTIDTLHILKNPPLDFGPAGKIRTLRKQIQEVTGDGKVSMLSVQEEHILFQESMYLCTHIFGDSKGAKHTDVYLWAGTGVADPTIEDAQLFAKNYAKQNQARLMTIRQGQEPPNFFEALGGIVITRRGVKPASQEFMLCGRRHLGHLAFDEVEFSLKSFCSAFSYLISTSSGKVHLWKGRGCSAEELSGARLMGMDLTPTGDFTEVEEGSEPQSFIDIFPPPAVPGKGPAILRSADYWRYKATSDKYRVRLYKIEQHHGQTGWGQALQVSSSFFAPLLRRPSYGLPAEPRPQTPVTPTGSMTTSVKEIMPFCQRDLEPESIYVLDAFFDMYIIIGALSRTQHQAFATALLFAQAYSMDSVPEEDRPFIPVTTVVMEGVPRDMKAAFRHWDDGLIPAAGLMRGKLGRGKSLRIVKLNEALEATRR
ncbi:hypothetical protein GQ44DRAFT_767496 [Phaeosphaeriaceae sp. PMI808]|nr:hypothetical protein GQ44DRAFT_767496 [Phaeosphaeriaceae sp. PMI808]